MRTEFSEWVFEKAANEDACLRHQSVALLRPVQAVQSLQSDEFTAALAGAHEYAKQNQLTAIEALFPIDQGHLTEVLVNQGFSPVLDGYSLSVATDQMVSPLPEVGNDLLWVDTCAVTELISSLLMDQASVHHRLIPEYYFSPDEIEREAYATQIAEVVSTPLNASTFAVHNNHVVACGIAWKEGKQTNLWELVVDEKWRNQGLGTAVLRRVAQRAMEQASTNLYTEVAVGNTADTLYQRLGWSQTDQTWFKPLT